MLYEYNLNEVSMPFLDFILIKFSFLRALLNILFDILSNMLSMGTLLQLIREGIHFGESLKINRIFEFFMNGFLFITKKINIY